MSSEILVMRAAIVERLREVLPGVDVQEHPRVSISGQDVLRVIQTQPSKLGLRVAYTGSDGARDASYETDTPCMWAIYIVAGDIPAQATRPAISRDATILGLLPTILRTVAANHFDVGDVTARRPERVRAGELYGGEAEASIASAAIWAVEWTQMVSFTEELEDGALLPLLKLITSYDLAPANDVIDASDTIEFEQEDP